MGVRENECQFHKNCKNTGKILKISCVRCNSKSQRLLVRKLIDITHTQRELGMPVVLLQKCNQYCWVFAASIIEIHCILNFI